jgi:hypothetical protein
MRQYRRFNPTGREPKSLFSGVCLRITSPNICKCKLVDGQRQLPDAVQFFGWRHPAVAVDQQSLDRRMSIAHGHPELPCRISAAPGAAY